MKQISFRAMGCQMLATVDHDDPTSAAALAATPGWFAVWEGALSRFCDDSELARLNRRAGAGWTTVSPELWAVLAAALHAARTTGGLATPMILGALEHAGYDRDFMALAGGAVSPARGDCPAQIPDWRQIGMDARRRAVALPHGARLDFGGIAKGWAADSAARRLAIHGPALIDAGGDIAVSGPRADGTPWPIGVVDPRQSDAALDLLLLASGGVATSGRDYRRWRQGAIEQHHIIDPRTGAPAATDLLSVTVVAPTARQAEAAAKAVFILGSAAAVTWLLSRPSLAGLLVTGAGDVVRTPNLERYRWREPADEGVS